MIDLKRMAAYYAANYLSDGMRVGLGTGSTVQYAIKKIGELVAAGLNIVAVPTSLETENRARAAGIQLTYLDEQELDIAIDGADQINPDLDVIKGGGGALLREKMIAMASKKVIIIVDEMKLVKQFTFPLPVEVIPYGWKRTATMIKKIGLNPRLRQNVTTDNKNYILDCSYDRLEDIENLELALNGIPGVVENGLFIDIVSEVVVGTASGPKTIRRS